MKEMTSESQLNLTSYYKELPRAIAPKTDFVERVAEKTGKNIATVRFWVMGKTKPSDPKDLEILVTTQHPRSKYGQKLFATARIAKKGF